MKGIDLVTDEKGNNKALLLDLVYFKKENIKAQDILSALSNLQDLIDSTNSIKAKENTWETAKEKLNQFKE